MPLFDFAPLSLSNSGCVPEVAIQGQKEEIKTSMWENKLILVHRHKTKKNDMIENTFPYFHSINVLFLSTFKQKDLVI